MNCDKLTQFNQLNQLNLLSPHIICALCNDWLTKQIYLHPDNRHYCQTCSSASNPRRLFALEDIHDNLLFPCKYESCDYITKGRDITTHQENCPHIPLNCHLCNDKDMNKTTLVGHLLAEHADNVIKCDTKHEFNITLRNGIFTDTRIAYFNQHTFLIHVRRQGSSFSVNVAMLETIYDENVKKCFQVSCKCDNLEYKFRKDFVQYSTLLHNSEQHYDVHLKHDTALDIALVLCDFDKVKERPDCMVCGGQVYKCMKNHLICKQCVKNKVEYHENCDEKLHLVALMQEFNHCPNFYLGCLAVCSMDKLPEHLNHCPYALRICVHCNERCLRWQVLKHVESVHRLRKNFHSWCVGIKDSRIVPFTFYTTYQNEIFSIQLETKGIARDKKVCFVVRLLYSESPESSQKFQYIIHILNKNAKILYLLKGICQPATDQNLDQYYPTWISFDTCSKAFSGAGKSQKLTFQIVILDLEQ